MHQDVELHRQRYDGLATTPPTRYCDGTPITDVNQVAMVRVDGTSVTGGIDWNATAARRI